MSIDRDFVDVSDRVLARKAVRVESWIETVATAIAAIVFGCLLVVVLAFLSV